MARAEGKERKISKACLRKVEQVCVQSTILVLFPKDSG